MDAREFLVQARLTSEVLEAWIDAGWLLPCREGNAHNFSDIDLARCHLIRDLKHDLGVNDEGVPVILDLIDQVHGLRRTLRSLLATIEAQSDATRHRIAADIRAALGSDLKE
jgi:chaperone modulatory protein CbpM